MKKALLISALLVLLASCQQRVFDVDEAVWNTLNESEREKVIDGYNTRKEIELANFIKQREKELDNKRHQQEVDAQTAPFRAAADAFSSLCKTPNDDTRIQSIKNRILTINDSRFEASTKVDDTWLKGQPVQITKNPTNALYPLILTNLDNGETLQVRKTK